VTPLNKARQGIPITLIDKLRTIGSLAEMDGFKDQIRRDGQELTKDEWAMIARFKAELEQAAWTRNS